MTTAKSFQHCQFQFPLVFCCISAVLYVLRYCDSFLSPPTAGGGDVFIFVRISLALTLVSPSTSVKLLSRTLSSERVVGFRTCIDTLLGGEKVD